MPSHFRFESDSLVCKQPSTCSQAFAGQIEKVLPIKKIVRRMHSNNLQLKEHEMP